MIYYLWIGIFCVFIYFLIKGGVQWKMKCTHREFKVIAENLGVDFIIPKEEERMGKVGYPELIGTLGNMPFDMFTTYGKNNSPSQPSYTIFRLQLPNVQDFLFITSTHQLETEPVLTGIDEFDNLFRVYSNRIDWIAGIFTPIFAQKMIELQEGALFNEGEFILQNGFLLYRRNFSLKFEAATTHILEVIGVSKILVENILEEF